MLKGGNKMKTPFSRKAVSLAAVVIGNFLYAFTVKAFLMPAGLVTGEAARPDSHSLRGEPGDWLLLVTDGILCGREDGWLQELLLGYQGTAPEELAGKVLAAAQDLQEGEDDATVIALRLDKAQP